MKNVSEVYFHVTGDLFLKYEISARPRGTDEVIKGETVFLDVKTDKVRAVWDAGLLCFPSHGGTPCEDPQRRNDYKASYNPNGTLTALGVVRIVKSVAEYLEETASDVWELIDPRCSAKIPSRLYHRTADVCADVLTHLGIPAKVVKLPLDPEKHNGLRNQYRVVVITKVPIYPWKVERQPHPDNPNRMRRKVISSFRDINFDFDCTNGLRLRWTWPDSRHISGWDARVLRNGNPVRWVGEIEKTISGEPVKFTVTGSTGGVTDTLDDIGLLMLQTSILDTMGVEDDDPMDERLEAVRRATSTPSAPYVRT